MDHKHSPEVISPILQELLSMTMREYRVAHSRINYALSVVPILIIIAAATMLLQKWIWGFSWSFYEPIFLAVGIALSVYSGYIFREIQLARALVMQVFCISTNAKTLGYKVAFNPSYSTYFPIDQEPLCVVEGKSNEPEITVNWEKWYGLSPYTK
jgi:hypothetical protein